MDRIKILLDFLKEEPNDPFNHYGLAIEYQKVNKIEAENKFTFLLKEFPEYLPTYYTAAKFFEDEKEDYEKSIEIYEKGISLASKLNEIKAFNELTSAKTNLEFELD